MPFKGILHRKGFLEGLLWKEETFSIYRRPWEALLWKKRPIGDFVKSEEKTFKGSKESGTFKGLL